MCYSTHDVCNNVNKLLPNCLFPAPSWKPRVLLIEKIKSQKYFSSSSIQSMAPISQLMFPFLCEAFQECLHSQLCVLCMLFVLCIMRSMLVCAYTTH